MLRPCLEGVLTLALALTPTLTLTLTLTLTPTLARWGVTREDLSRCDTYRIGACISAMFISMAVQVRVRVRVSPNPDPNQDRRAPVCVEHALQPAGHVPHHHQPGQQEERSCSRVGVRLRVGLGLGPGSRV